MDFFFDFLGCKRFITDFIVTILDHFNVHDF